MALTYDSDPDLPVKPFKEGIAHAVKTNRKYEHEIQGSRAAAADPNAPTTVLTEDQLKQCGYAYINNPMVRRTTNTLVFFTQSGRTRAVVEANDELLEISNDEETKKLQEQINDDTLTIGGTEQEEESENEDGTTTTITTSTGGEPARIKELKRKIVRLGKRCKLHMNTKKGLTSQVVFGRGFLEIVRLPTNPDWPIYGEPVALKHLVSKNVVQCYFNTTTGEFEGIDYNTNKTLNPIKFIKATNLIPFFQDDNNIMENTQGSGLSLVWPILSVSQADDVINDEDIPEITKNTGGVLTIVKATTNDDNKLEEITNKLDGKTQVVVGQDLINGVESVQLGRDPHELTDVRTADSKYITQGMNVPLFTIFEDTANFATANQAMQVYKAGALKDFRTSLQGSLEDYWYDTILADHFNIEVKDVISLPIKVKAVFDDINFETRKEIVEADKILFDMQVFDRMDIAKDIDRSDLVPRLEEEEAEKEAKALEIQENQANALEIARQQQNQSNEQATVLQMAKQAQMKQAQQASAAASIKEKEKEQEYHERRLEVLGKMNKVLDNL